MATDLRQGGRGICRDIEWSRHKQSPDPTEVDGRKEVLQINAKDPSLSTVNFGVRHGASPRHKPVDVRPWFIRSD